jgi:hypothetical protein
MRTIFRTNLLPGIAAWTTLVPGRTDEPQRVFVDIGLMDTVRASAMKAFPGGRATQCGTNGVDEYGVSEYSGAVLSSYPEILQLRDGARQLMQQDEPLLDPEFFLASVSKGWAPRVVTVYKRRDMVGIMYTRERIISGVPTGVVYADGSLGDILLANPMHQPSALRVAVETLLAASRVYGVRLRFLRGWRELRAIKQLIGDRPFDAHYSRIEYNDSRIEHNDSSIWKYHAHLPLPNSYEEFLKSLGSTTRHNFRYYQRRFAKAGHSFVENLSMRELRAAAPRLASRSKFSHELPHYLIERDLNMVAATRRPIAIGLKDHNGEWISVMGGWYGPRGAVLLFQYNNDRDFGQDSLSVVLRAYFIESLIRQGLQELVIWGGTAPPLSRYVTYQRTIGVHLDAPTSAWRIARFLISTVGPWLPRRLAYAARSLA